MGDDEGDLREIDSVQKKLFMLQCFYDLLLNVGLFFFSLFMSICLFRVSHMPFKIIYPCVIHLFSTTFNTFFWKDQNIKTG